MMFALVATGAAQIASLPSDVMTSSATQVSLTQSSELQPSSSILIGTGDLLAVSVFGVQDYKPEVRVAETGDVSLPLVGAVHVAGSTVNQAQQLIAKSMVDGQFFRNPQVSIFVKEYGSQGVSVLGEVGHPGTYPVYGPRRLFEMISAAGGLTSKAGKLVSIAHRNSPQDVHTVTLETDPAKPLDGNVEVEPGDTIVVGRAGIVYVVGDVGRPGGFVMENGDRMTVLQAIALAQGVNRTAALGACRIIRHTPQGPIERQITLKKILAAKQDDVYLAADDILFIPGSAAKSAAKRGIDSVLQSAAALAIYVH